LHHDCLFGLIFRPDVEEREMPLLRIAFLAAVVMVAADGVGHACENTPLLNIYQVAYPVVWNGKTIMIGARLQLPAGAKGKMPAVIMMHGTGGIRYSGVYYAAARPAGPRISAIICPILPGPTIYSQRGQILTPRASVSWENQWEASKPCS
jgi:hypothetical protein